MTEWDKLKAKQPRHNRTMKNPYYTHWVREMVAVGDKLHLVNKELKKELESCAEKSWIKREKLEAIRGIATLLDVDDLPISELNRAIRELKHKILEALDK